MLMPKLLIVDDQPEIRKMLRIALAKTDYQLFEAANGDEALAIAFAEKPDVVLLDVMMPGILDGFAVCRAIKGDPELAGAFVVMLTARGTPNDYQEGDAAGADAYVIKPCILAKLVEIIETRAHPGKPVRAYA
jgi:two-component system, OmpR family, phosphate regulon response regulator PhoB